MKTNKTYKYTAILIILGVIFINNSSIAQSKSESSTNDIHYKTKCIKLSADYRFSGDDLTKFNTWIKSTLKQSARENKYAIIVDKAAYTLYLIDSGKFHSEYPIELGFNPYDDKIRAGDGCTPEGEFYLTEKKTWSNYYKAFLISYPSIEDAKRGLDEGLINTAKYNQIVEAIENKKTPEDRKSVV